MSPHRLAEGEPVHRVTGGDPNNTVATDETLRPAPPAVRSTVRQDRPTAAGDRVSHDSDRFAYNNRDAGEDAEPCVSRPTSALKRVAGDDAVRCTECGLKRTRLPCDVSPTYLRGKNPDDKRSG